MPHEIQIEVAADLLGCYPDRNDKEMCVLGELASFLEANGGLPEVPTGKCLRVRIDVADPTPFPLD